MEHRRSRSVRARAVRGLGPAPRHRLSRTTATSSSAGAMQFELGQLVPPFHVTHVDAHADLGLGDSGYRYLLSEVLALDVEGRSNPKTGEGAMDHGNFLAFAIACRWIAELTYVFCPGGGDDVLFFVREDYRPDADRLQLVPTSEADLDNVTWGEHNLPVGASRLEPPVPFRQVPAAEFAADGPFDFVFLARSPAFTPLGGGPDLQRPARRVYQWLGTGSARRAIWHWCQNRPLKPEIQLHRSLAGSSSLQGFPVFSGSSLLLKISLIIVRSKALCLPYDLDVVAYPANVANVQWLPSGSAIVKSREG